mgnify:CR=1 FL=1
MPGRTNRKIIPAGTSVAVTLPPHWLRALKIKKGDEVEVLYNFVLLIKPKNVAIDFAFLEKELHMLAKLDKQTEEVASS